MAKENINLDFRPKKNACEMKNFLLDEYKPSELLNEKHEKVCGALDYFKHFLIFVSAVHGCVTTSAFALLDGIPAGIASSALELKICGITAGMKKYKPITKKNY